MFDEFFVNMDILRVILILHPTAGRGVVVVAGGGGGGGCCQTSPKTCFTQKYGGFKTQVSFIRCMFGKLKKTKKRHWPMETGVPKKSTKNEER